MFISSFRKGGLLQFYGFCVERTPGVMCFRVVPSGNWFGLCYFFDGREGIMGVVLLQNQILQKASFGFIVRSLSIGWFYGILLDMAGIWCWRLFFCTVGNSVMELSVLMKCSWNNDRKLKILTVIQSCSI